MEAQAIDALCARYGISPEGALRLIERELAKQSLIEFGRVAFAGFQAPRHLQYLASLLERAERGEIKRLAISFGPGHGKLVADDELVPTPRGWSRHGDLSVGDQVFGVDGTPTIVVATSAPDVATLEVELSDGTTVAVHPRHEWTADLHGNRDYKSWETRDIASYLSAHPSQYGRGNRNHFFLPEVRGIDGRHNDSLPIDPYVLGAWLGDGTHNKACIAHHIDEREVVEAIAAAGYENTATCLMNGGTTGASYFRGGLHTALKTAGVFGNKHIPVAYLRASREQRLELLAGLIDTDGHVTHNPAAGDFVRIVGVDERLISGIKELVAGLGWRCADHVAQPTTSTSGIVGKRPVHTLKFVPDCDIPTRLLRKKILSFRKTRRRVSIVAVREIAPRPGKCIQVAAADGLYLVGRTMQPTHNSTLLQCFLAWFLGRDPKRRILSLSAGEMLARRNSRAVRSMVQAESWPFDTELVGESLEEWQTDQGGGVRAIGQTGTVTGFRAEMILCDDVQPDAGSDTTRETMENWFREVLSTRLEPNGIAVVIQTRWHDSDLIGRLAEGESADQWTFVNIPTIATSDDDVLGRKEGEALWPERWPIELLEQKKQEIGPTAFSAQYQGDPVPAGGAMFAPEWFEHRYDSLPAHRVKLKSEQNPSPVIRIQSIDCAAKTGIRNDRTVIATLVSDLNDIYIEDVWFGRIPFTDLKRKVPELYERFRPRTVYVEEASNGYALLDELRGSTSIPLVGVKPGTDSKEARAESVTGWFESGRIKFPRHALWMQELLGEFLRFPYGRHDDIVDAVVLGVHQMQSAIAVVLQNERHSTQVRGMRSWMVR